MRGRDLKTGRFVKVEDRVTPDWISQFESTPDLSGEELIELRAADRRHFNRHYVIWLVGTIVAMVAMFAAGYWSR